MRLYAWSQGESYRRSAGVKSSSVREIVLDKRRIRVSVNSSVPTRDCVHLYRRRMRQGNATSYTMHGASGDNKGWLSRYETTNYCILYVYVADLYPTRSG